MYKISVSDEFRNQVADHEKELTQLLFNRVFEKFDTRISVERKRWQHEVNFDSCRRSLYFRDIQDALKTAKDDCAVILRFSLSLDDVEDMYTYTLYEINDVYVQAVNDLELHYESIWLPFD